MQNMTKNDHDTDLTRIERALLSFYGSPSVEATLIMQDSFAAVIAELRETRRENRALRERLGVAA